MKTVCYHCGAIFDIEPEVMGSELECAQCKASFVAEPIRTSGLLATDSSGPSAAPKPPHSVATLESISRRACMAFAFVLVSPPIMFIVAMSVSRSTATVIYAIVAAIQWLISLGLLIAVSDIAIELKYLRTIMKPRHDTAKAIAP